MRTLLVLVVSLFATTAYAGNVNLQLNDVGVTGLEQVLDVARKYGPNMRDAEMAVSIYNALQAAKQQSAQSDAARLDLLEKQKNDLQSELDKVKAELEKLKNPPEDGK